MPLPCPPAGLFAPTCALSNVAYAAGTYAASSSSWGGCNDTAWLAFTGCNVLGNQAGAAWTSAPSYTSVNGQAYSPDGPSALPSTTVDGTPRLGQWLQLALPSNAPVQPFASYSIVPALSSGAAGVPDGQPTQFLLAGLTAGGTWTALDATYAATPYRIPNAAINVALQSNAAAAWARAPFYAVRLVVTAVSVSASPASNVIPATVCALQLAAPPAQAVWSLAPDGTGALGGPLGVGTAAPTQSLDVRGGVAIAGNVGIGTQPSATFSLLLARDSAAKPSTNTWTVFSDRRLKRDCAPADLARCYDIVRSVPLTRFSWRDDVHAPADVPDRTKLGWLAQDVAAAFPKSVESRAAFGLPDCLSMNSDQLLAALYGAVQLLQQRVGRLRRAPPSGRLGGKRPLSLPARRRRG
jgi:hypothetical protein